MKKLFTVLIVATLLVSSVWATGSSQGRTQEADQELSYVYSGEITSLNYYTQGSQTTYGKTAILLDGLVENNKYGVQIPNIATKWENSSNGLIWTFTLRNDVKWVDYTGKVVANVTAKDFVSAAKYCLTQANAPYYEDFYTDYFVGAQAYWDSTAPGKTPLNFDTVGVKAVNDYTLQYTLTAPCPYFMSMMNWVPFYPVYQPFLDSVGDKFGTSNDNILYCGAFIMQTWRPQNTQVYVKNPSYYLANEIHISKMTYTYNAEASTLAPELFKRGEVSGTDIQTSIVNDWLKDPQLSKLIRPSTDGFYSYFYAFNFDPNFAAEYEPENWKIAVNNLNFRKAVASALNRVNAIMTEYSGDPQGILTRTVTPPGFCVAGGKDYTQTGDLARISNTNPFDVAAAARYRDAARTELRAAGATFPIKVLMPYNSGGTEWTQRAQVVKQNLESVLGADFIQIMIYGAPPTNFLGDNRRNGRFALLECNWGPDYSDPETFTDPFVQGGTYNKPWMATGGIGSNYASLVTAAKAEKVDIARRYELFARAEAFLIDNAMVVPYRRSVPGWVASYLNPFEFNYSSANVMSENKMNNVRKLAAPMGAAEFVTLREQWNKDREAALRALAGR
jgi:oligopeptide transport system substrate-binding protein